MPLFTSPRPGLEFGQGLIDFTDEDLYGIEINPFPYGNAPAELIYIDQPNRVSINTEDFAEMFPDVELEEGETTYIDEETGTIYVIFPVPPGVEPVTPGGGGGGAPSPVGGDDGGDVVDINDDDTTKDDEEDPLSDEKENEWEYIGNGRFRHRETGEIVSDPNYDPEADNYIVGDFYSIGEAPSGEDEEDDEVVVRTMPTVTTDRPVKTEQPTEVITVETPAPEPEPEPEPEPAPEPEPGPGEPGGNGGNGGGNNGGNGGGEGPDAQGLMKPEFDPFQFALNYQPVQLQQQITSPRKDYMQQLDALIGRSLFGKMLG